ncbi:SCO family protein [Pararhodobacter oceanensis]|uniref:SCO family protein n=1 Tax=Pararhodobacter oceanensis TaxID=2172121 RepID=A0A2T8HSF5_9RHOB|nr:SCO family protein [Pararhodobacter oceanensis]PVH28371.1 SCO family protein [Pararhodobacter oceanensis]
MIRAYSIGAASFLAVVLGVMGYLMYGGNSDDPFAPCRTTAMQGGLDAIGGPFELINAQGETVTDADVITQPSMVYFGYTFCPDVCPLDMARNALATEILEDEGHIVQPVFITIDPRRDTPEVVGEFASIFHDRAVGLTGSDEQVRAASRAYRTFYSAHQSDDDFYLVDHSTFTYLVMPGHGTVEVLRQDLTAEQVAQTAQCFIERA